MNGKKTYIAGIGSILVAVGSYLTGSMDVAEAVQLAVTAILGMTLRHGIATK